MSANIETSGEKCRKGCRLTTRDYPLRGDVRRCGHGRVWVATGREAEGYFYNTLYVWRRLSRFWDPIRFRRAVKALAASPVTAEANNERKPG